MEVFRLSSLNCLKRDLTSRVQSHFWHKLAVSSSSIQDLTSEEQKAVFVQSSWILGGNFRGTYPDLLDGDKSLTYSMIFIRIE